MRDARVRVWRLGEDPTPLRELLAVAGRDAR